MDGERLRQRREADGERGAWDAGGRGELQFGKHGCARGALPVLRLQRCDEMRAVFAQERDGRIQQRSRGGRERYFGASAGSGFPTGVDVAKRMRMATTPETKKAPVGPTSALQSTAPRYCRAAGPIARTRPTMIVR